MHYLTLILTVGRELAKDGVAAAKKEFVSYVATDAVAAVEDMRSTLVSVRKDLTRQRELLDEERAARHAMIGQYNDEKALAEKQFRTLLEGRDRTIRDLRTELADLKAAAQ
jgi:hypothetical protein